MAHIVLASASPRRQELLRRMGITEFDIPVPETEETYPEGLSPRQIVEYISREKADAAAKLCTSEEIVITADTMVFLDDQRLGKPADEDDALRMLTALQGRRHTVCTGVTVRQGSRAVVSVTNQGPDIPSDKLPRIFDRFYRADDARTDGDSFGLGLPIAKAIVDAHRGVLRCDSSGGVTTFSISLPLTAGKQERGTDHV